MLKQKLVDFTALPYSHRTLQFTVKVGFCCGQELTDNEDGILIIFDAEHLKIFCQIELILS